MKTFDISLKKTLPLFLMGLFIVGILVAVTGTDKILDAISQIDKNYYSLAFIVQILAIFVWLCKWKILTMAIDLDVGTRKMFPILLSGIFVNTAIPSAKMGGEPLRAYIFSKIGDVPMDKSFASVASDRAIDGIPFIGIVLPTLLASILVWDLPILAIGLLILLAALLSVGIVSFLYVIIRPGPAQGIVQWLIHHLRRIIVKFRPIEYVEKKAENFLEEFGYGARQILGNKKYATSALILSSLYWFFTIFRMWLVFLALGHSVPLTTVGLAVSLGLILQLAPIPGGLGIVESIYILIFNAAGIPAGVSFSAAFLDRIISFWFTSLFCAGGMAWSGLELSKSWES